MPVNKHDALSTAAILHTDAPLHHVPIFSGRRLLFHLQTLAKARNPADLDLRTGVAPARMSVDTVLSQGACDESSSMRHGLDLAPA
jgi:hypothetical protein